MIISSYQPVSISESRELIRQMRLNQKQDFHLINTAFKGKRTVHSLNAEGKLVSEPHL